MQLDNFSVVREHHHITKTNTTAAVGVVVCEEEAGEGRLFQLSLIDSRLAVKKHSDNRNHRSERSNVFITATDAPSAWKRNPRYGSA